MIPRKIIGQKCRSEKWQEGIESEKFPKNSVLRSANFDYGMPLLLGYIVIVDSRLKATKYPPDIFLGATFSDDNIISNSNDFQVFITF